MTQDLIEMEMTLENYAISYILRNSVEDKNKSSSYIVRGNWRSANTWVQLL
jgi:hypothetical protein